MGIRNIMEDSETYQELLQEGMAKGMVKGMQQGMQQGIEQERKASVLKVLAVRCGAVPPDLAARVEAMTDPTALDSLLVAACKAETFGQFRSAVGW